MRFCLAGRGSKVTLHELAWRAWRLRHEGGARLHAYQRRLSGPRPGDSSPSVAVLTKFRGQGISGDVVLSRGTTNGDELAPQGQAAPDQAATAIGRANPGSRRGEQRRTSATARHRRTALQGNSPAAKSRRRLGALVS